MRRFGPDVLRDGVTPVFFEAGASPVSSPPALPPGSIVRFGTTYYENVGTLASPSYEQVQSGVDALTTVQADPTVSPPAGLAPGTVIVYSGGYYENVGTLASPSYDLIGPRGGNVSGAVALQVDPRIGAGVAASVGAWGVAGGCTFEKTGAADASWTMRAGSIEDEAHLRAATFLGTHDLERFIWEPFPVSTHTSSHMLTDVSNGTVGDLNSGVWQPACTAGGAGRWAAWQVPFTPIEGDPRDVKWYLATSARISTAPSGGWCAPLMIAPSQRYFRCGIGDAGGTYFGVLSAASNLVASPDTVVDTTVPRDLNWHRWELYSLGGGGANQVHGAIDRLPSVAAGTINSTGTTLHTVLGKVHNGAGTNAAAFRVDWMIGFRPRASAL